MEILNQNISNSSYSRFIKIKKLEKNNFHRIKNSNIIIDHEDKIGKPYNSLIDKNIENIKQISTIEDWYESTFERIPVDLFTLENISQIKQKSSRNNISNKVKRIGDILLSLFLLILLIPISLIVSILIWLEDRGPIIYKQKRVGLNGKIINIKSLLNKDVYNSFSEAIKERSTKQHKNETTFIGISLAEIKDHNHNNDLLEVSVNFISEIITCIKDKENKIISGDPQKIKRVNDTWKFSRNIRSQNPNWQLIETEV